LNPRSVKQHGGAAVELAFAFLARAGQNDLKADAAGGGFPPPADKTPIASTGKDGKTRKQLTTTAR
jgi:hypothetical protein